MIDSKRTREAVMDRGIGCLVGLAVGDALGATLEFKARDEHPPVTDLVGGGTFNLKPGEWTDDTSMALCLADSLIESNGLNAKDLMERFIRWRDDGENSPTGYCIDVGGTITDAINRFLRTGNPESGPVHEYAAGNGSIMRLAPVALRWHNDPEAARRHARVQSRTTHGAPQAVEASALLADILVDAIKTGDKDYALRPRDAGRSRSVANRARRLANEATRRHQVVGLRRGYARGGALVGIFLGQLCRRRHSRGKSRR